MKLKSFILALLIVISFGAPVFAQNTGGQNPLPKEDQQNPIPKTETDGSPTKTKVAPASGASDFNLQVRLNNPLKVDTIEEALALFMSMVLRIAIPFIIVFFIWSGLNFILARGNKDKLEKAKKMFWYTIIGSLLILGAWTITNAIIGTVNSITG